MKKIIILVSIALVILIGVQLYWIQNAYTYKQNQFREKVNQVLTKTSKFTVEESTCFELFGKTIIKPNQGLYFAKQPLTSKGQFITQEGKGPDSVKMFFMANGDTNVYCFNSIKFMSPLTAEFVLKCRYYFGDTMQSDFQKAEFQNIENLNYKDFRAKLTGPAPITSRLKMRFLDSCLKSLMAAAELGNSYHYGIVRNDNDSVEFNSPKSDAKKVKSSIMSAGLIDDKYFNHPYRLALYFDSGNMLALNTLWGILLTSAIVILLLCY